MDPATREVGVAVASCTGGVEITAGLVPDRGAVAAQAIPNLTGRFEAVRMLRAGAEPRAVIEAVTGPDFDSPYGLPLYRLRQYGVAALDAEPGAASYTGAWTLGWSGAAQGNGVAVQGNLLYGPDVVGASLAGFESAAERCDARLADRLLAGLEAGAAHFGDRRCSKAQTGLSALLAVARPGDDPREPTLFLLVPEQEPGRDNPVVLLRERYEAWRRENPPLPRECPAPP